MSRKMKVMLLSALMALLFVTNASMAMAAEVSVSNYEELVAELNDSDADTIKIDGNIDLNSNLVLGEKLIIAGDVTVSGNYTITRADSYTGTLFAVNAGASLTLDGGLTIDGGNEWTMDMEAYSADLKSFAKVSDSQKYFTPEEGAPVATAHMITVSGTGATVNLNKVTIKNHYATSEKVLVSAGTGATVNLNGAKITHNAIMSGSGLVVNASSGKWDTTPVIWVNMNNGTVIDGNHVGGNHGVFKVYMGTVFTMNGGSIKNTTGWNSNGVAVGVYWATFNMNGGEICSNSGVYGPNNGRCAPVYLHSASIFTMTDGSICHNVGGSRSGLDAPYTATNGTATITGGYIGENSSYYNDNGVEGYDPDITAGEKLIISGGTYTQDVSQWLADGLSLYKYSDGTYGVEKAFTVEISLTSEDATLTVTDAAGNTIQPQEDGTYYLAKGTYVYNVYLNGEVIISEIFDVMSDMSFSVDVVTRSDVAVDPSVMPQTGDNSSLLLWSALLAMTGVAFALMMKKCRA